jgi:multiple sugar transport system substrate-binding protein
MRDGSGWVSLARGWSRKEFLKLGGASLAAGTGLLGVAGCGESSSGKVTLRYGIWDQAQMPAMEKIVEEFSRANAEITVEIELTPYEEYLSKLQNAAQGGTLPDVFWMEPIWFELFASNDILRPITDQIKENGIDLGTYPENIVRFFQYRGDTYALPKDFDTIGLWYNEKLFDDAGVSYPDQSWGWQDFTDVAVELTDRSKGVWGTAAPLDPQQGHWNTIYQQGGCIVCGDDGRLRSGYDSEAAVSGVEFWTDLILEHKASPTLADMTETEPFQAFFSGKIAMIYLGSWNAVLLKEQKEIAESINVAPLPAGQQRSTCTNGLGNVISADTEYPEEAWEFARFLGGDKAMDIQARTGTVIPALKGTAGLWVEQYPGFDAQVFIDEREYAEAVPISPDTAKWQEEEFAVLRNAWTGKVAVEEACSKLAGRMNTILSEG